MADILRHHRHHNPRIGEIPVPHGPETGQEHDDYPAHHTSDYERRIFAHITRPDDSYTANGAYWADLPLRERVPFVAKVDREEAAKELRVTGRMMKQDPLSPLTWYFRHAVLPGAGLGLEGYVLFSIGNLEPLFAAAWPQCWGPDATVCAKNWIASVTYLEIVGIMIGQVGVGIIGDWIGRRWGLIQDALIMLLGLLLLTASWADSLQGWVIFYAWSLFVYGFGVGGEYPITATSSMESAVTAGRLSTRDDRLHRGRRVTSAFLMQGWGQLANQVVLIALLAIFNGGGAAPYSVSAAQFTFRLSFAFPAIGTLWLVYYRTWKMPRANRQLDLAKRRSGVTGYDVAALRGCVRHFGGRLLATAGTWFCNDVFFYGNKLFQGRFISVISTNPDSVMEKWTWNFVNVVVSLAGYYAASLLIDNKLYGRKMMQQVGFLVCFITFVIPAFRYDYYTSPEGIRSFQAMYFLSSFFNQFGPNSVTFLAAGEVFPTPVRASAHGFSACMGKAGALLAAVLYSYLDDREKFRFVPWFGLAGVLLTWLFLPDTTGLDLREQERRWDYIRRGKADEYRGVAVHPAHLSLWERMRGVGRAYDPGKDLRARIDDLRVEWEAEQEVCAAEKESDEAQDVGDWSEEIHGYFRGSSKTEECQNSDDEKGRSGSAGSNGGVMTGRSIGPEGGEENRT
ncbi:MFS general substrate transporter [Sodiomyces alkalinus F11]|uniref:MFS general substrate transporter n=1 Tax=Sodiomyces alkalinus (strain CBS 110278 / VKM F-3762 / F11) TaxID=1314773 RepID=A0A3N2PZ82_SODAK|nr:MFS general substrate transporter [Sodiomyces alkalinus F11]ROT39830.1 MFS general substrate transporter [Sodiomyces alkalinus F11]